MHPRPHHFAALSASLLLAACASPGDYPSLARRDAERFPQTAEPVARRPAGPVPAQSVAGPALRAQLHGLEERARTAHARFLRERSRAIALVAAGAGAARGSESWSVATIALSGLESARSDTMVALADLDSLLAADRVAHPNEQSGDGYAIAASRENVIALVGEEDRILAGLAARLN